MRVSMLVSVLALSGCSGGATEPTPAAAPTPVVSSALSVPPAAPVSAPPPPSIDLLTSTTTHVAVSSAYHDDPLQIDDLVDGDPETAWNSRSGDLVGASIEVRVPPEATVTSIELTAGFTHRTERADLFTGNHRVTRVRVAHDGAVTEHALDPESRELQTIPVTGGGGVYRIEVAALEPGSNASWQEVCISELRVMGRVPDAREGARYPQLSIGALPAPDATPLDVAALAAAHPGEVAWLARAWAEHERAEHRFDASTGDCDDPPSAWNSAQRARRAILARVAALAAPADVVLADALRRRAATPRARPACIGDDRRRHAEREADLTAIAAALDAVGTRLDDAARCRWARAHAELRVLRLAQSASNEWYLIEYNGEFEIDTSPAESRRQGVVETMRDQLDGWRWPGSAAGLARLRRLDRSALPTDGADFDALYGALDRAEAACAAR
jgi:hypothetical protein